MFPARRLIYAAFLFFAIPLAAQNQEPRDSVVKELSAQSNQLIEEHGISYRKVIGPARFLHNNTYLVCDTAMWNVNSGVIEATGNVQILQDQTVLKSDRLEYVIDENVAKFRGVLVQLQDKDRNTLRTKYLDYNTRDSVAVFYNGGALKDKDGQVIESITGTYDSKVKTFTFTEQVNMYTDSVFIETSSLSYETDRQRAFFGNSTRAWKDDDMLSSNAGWYDRTTGVYLFKDQVHIQTEAQEGWADSLYYYSTPGNAEMLGNAQILDTSRNVSALAGRMFYEDSLSRITLTRDPVIIAETGGEDKPDTLWVGADKLVYTGVRKCDIAESEIKASQARLEEISADAVTQYRRNAAEEARKAYEEEKRRMEEDAKGNRHKDESPRLPAPWDDDPDGAGYLSVEDIIWLSALKDSLSTADSTAMRDSVAVTDSTAVRDSLQRDTTMIGFLTATGNVKAFRRDMQVVCDSLAYTDLDSLARLYRNPVIWNETYRQYSADSIAVAARNRTLDRASLMSNAIIIMQEESDTTLFNQIKGTEMMAWFTEEGTLARFDAMGGFQMLIYLEEKDTLATANKKEGKMLSAWLKDGNIDRIYYFDAPKSDAYPIVQLPRADRVLDGFDWKPGLRPTSPRDISKLEARTPERQLYSSYSRPEFKQTDIYFPGYMDEVHRGLARADSLKAVRARDREVARLAREDSLARVSDIAPADTLQPKPVTDSVSVSRDSLSATPKDSTGITRKMSPKQTAREQARRQRQEEREARWKKKDERDAAKMAAREERRKAKARKRALAILKSEQKKAEREQRELEKYRLRYEKKKAAEDARAARKSEQ